MVAMSRCADRRAEGNRLLDGRNLGPYTVSMPKREHLLDQWKLTCLPAGTGSGRNVTINIDSVQLRRGAIEIGKVNSSTY